MNPRIILAYGATFVACATQTAAPQVTKSATTPSSTSARLSESVSQTVQSRSSSELPLSSTSEVASVSVSSAPLAQTSPVYSNGLPVPDFGPVANPPLVMGYPELIRKAGELTGSVADYVGFTKDSKDFVYCVVNPCCYGGKFMQFECTMLDANGKARERKSHASMDEKPEYGVESKKIKDWIVAENFAQVTYVEDKEHAATGGIGKGIASTPMRGPWAFSEITLIVQPVRTANEFDAPKGHESFSKIGGILAGHKPVFPLTIGLNASGITGLNALQISPDGESIGVVFHLGQSHSESHTSKRMSTRRFAAMIYNEVAVRLASKNKHKEAIPYSLKATFADESWAWSAFNLACAYARASEVESAQKALELAVRRGGKPIKDKAPKDSDLKSLWNLPWFKLLIKD